MIFYVILLDIHYFIKGCMVRGKIKRADKMNCRLGVNDKHNTDGKLIIYHCHKHFCLQNSTNIIFLIGTFQWFFALSLLFFRVGFFLCNFNYRFTSHLPNILCFAIHLQSWFSIYFLCASNFHLFHQSMIDT